jgi:glycosyltransferase involved in cell wall biosynthesis
VSSMHVLELSYMFPSPRHPTSGIFIARQVRELARHVALDVVSPVPWAPRLLQPLSPRWQAYGAQPAASVYDGVAVHHPRYVQPIGQWSMPVAGAAMALGAAAVVRRLARTRGADVIHAQQLLPDGLAAVLLARRLGRPVVCALRGNDVTTVPFHDPAVRAAARLVARRCAAFIAVHEGLVPSLRALRADAPVHVIPNGVDTAAFRHADRVEARRMLGLPADARLVVFAGLVIARKGVDVLIEAFARVPDAMLVVVGGSDERDDLRTVLAGRAAALGCGDRVRFVGRRPHAEMPLWLAAADVFTLPSRREGFPNVVREAIAAGTPCVATALPGMAEIVTPACGTVVPVDDADALAAALAGALRRRWDRDAIRRRAAGWRWEQNAADVLAVLSAAAGAGTRAVA